MLRKYIWSINLILIIGGAALAFYGQSRNPDLIWAMIVGMVMLALGLYRTSRNIPSKSTAETENTNSGYVIDESFDDRNDLKE